jgi:predicted nuclease of predicted toxin-antitoxin system
MARLYADENFPFPVVEVLRQLGHDVVTAQEAGKAEQEIPDPEVLSFAVEQGRALLTLNRRHFIRLHLMQPNHAGIISCTFDLAFTAQAVRIDAALAPLTGLRGQLIRVNRPSE